MQSVLPKLEQLRPCANRSTRRIFHIRKVVPEWFVRVPYLRFLNLVVGCG